MRHSPFFAALLLGFSFLPFGFSYTPGEDIAVPPADRSSLYAPHRRDGQFFNPWNPHEVAIAKLARFILSKNPYDRVAPPQVAVVTNDSLSLSGHADPPRITWVGHSTFAIHEGDDVVLTDPHFGNRALVPARHLPPGIPLESIPADAFAVVSHSHYDHLDAETVDDLPATVQWFVPLGMGEWFRDRDRANVVELDWWESARRGDWTITCLPSQHWSRRLGSGINEMLWCSWLLDSGSHRYYFAGDTGYFHGFAEYGRVFAPIDVAMLPIGAYEPRWFMAYHHMDPAEAYRAFLDLKAHVMLPMHWGTFDLSHEPLDQPAVELRKVVAEHNADPARSPILAIGETWIVGSGE